MSASLRGRNVMWDKTLGRRLYDEGRDLGDIAAACKISKHALIAFSLRHWPRRAMDAERQAEKFLPASSKPAPAKQIRRGQSTLPPLASSLGEKPPWC